MYHLYIEFMKNPDEEKLAKFKEFIYNLGYNIHWTEEISPKSFKKY